MTGQMLTELQGRREGLGSVRMWRLRDLSLSLHAYEMGWQVPHKLWPNPPGGSDTQSRP